jgi:hypothetical protein
MNIPDRREHINTITNGSSLFYVITVIYEENQLGRTQLGS